MKSLKIKKLLMALAAMLMLIAVLPLTAHGQTKSGTAKTTVTKGQSKRLTGKAVFNDTNDGKQYKYKEWTSQGIVINCTLSQDGGK